jgi:hypothetical protein
MPRIVYHVRPGFVIRGDIQAIGEQLTELQRRNINERYPDGYFDNEELIEDSRPEVSPSHLNFTWDNDQAAHERRLDQAQRLRNSYGFKVIVEENETVHDANEYTVEIANSSIKDTVTGERLCVPSTFAASQPDLRCQVLEDAERLLQGAANRLRILKGISPLIIAAIEKLIQMIDKAKVKAKKKPAKSGK